MRQRIAVLLASALTAAACSGSSKSTPDAPVTPHVDAGTIVVDAPLPTIDAPLPTIDAPLPTIDAPLPTADAPRPDARLPPDSAPPEDAAVHDAATRDGPGAGDAGPSECLPECFTSILSSLVKDCLPAGACTFNGNILMSTTCFANGVKIVTTLSQDGITVVWENEAGTCYTTETTITGSSSTTLFKNGAGAVVAKIVVPDQNDPNIQEYTCGSSAPITVDTSTPACQAEQGDAGVGPDAGTCTMSAACQP